YTSKVLISGVVDQTVDLALLEAEVVGDGLDRVPPGGAGGLPPGDLGPQLVVGRAGRRTGRRTRHHQGGLASWFALARPGGPLGERATADFLVRLRQLAADGGRPVGTEGRGEIGQRARDPVRRLEEHQRAVLGGELPQARAAMRSGTRQEALEYEPVAGQPGE